MIITPIIKELHQFEQVWKFGDRLKFGVASLICVAVLKDEFVPVHRFPGMRQRKHLKYSLFFAAATLLCAEVFILFSLRGVLPGGVAPVQFTQPDNPLLAESLTTNWTDFDPGTLQEIRAAVAQDYPDILTCSPNDLPSVLRDWTRARAAGPNGMSLKTENPCIILNHLEDGGDYYCKPLADLYAAACAAFDTKARRIALFAEIGNFETSHASLEVWDGGKWVVHDPMFNSYAVGSENEKLSAAEIQQHYHEGMDVIWVQDKTPSEPSMDTYFVPPRELYSYIFYSLKGPLFTGSHFQYRLERIFHRLIDHTDYLLVTYSPMPVNGIILDGTLDRIIVFLAIVLIILGLLIKTGDPSVKPQPQ